MKKILFFTKSEAFGGIEKVLLDYCNNMDSKKYDITVLNWFFCEEIKSQLNKNVKYKYIFKKKEPRGIGRIVRDLPSKIVHKIFIIDKYDVEIAFQEGYTHKIISGASSKTKKIAWFHINPNYFNFNEPLCRSKEKLEKMLNNFDNLCFVSKFMKKWYEDSFSLDSNKLEVVYNPIDKEDVLNKSKEEITDIELDKNDFRIVCVGRLSVEKRFDRVINICRRIYEEGHRKIKLYIIGEGPQKNDLVKLIEEFSASNYVKLIGFSRNPYKYIKNSSLLICASDNIESFGLVVAEAMTLNTPVLSVKCGGPDEILDNGKYGMIVENNELALYEGLLAIMNNKELYNQYIYVEKNILNEFKIKRIKEQFDNIINKKFY